MGVDGKDVVERTGTPSINGYKLMKVADATPQIAPGESPMMTWGEVESTPYRLEGAETPLINPGPSKEGAPSFTMQASTFFPLDACQLSSITTLSTTYFLPFVRLIYLPNSSDRITLT